MFAAFLGWGSNDKALGCWQDLLVCTKPLCFKQVWKEMASEQRGGRSDEISRAAQPRALSVTPPQAGRFGLWSAIPYAIQMC